MKIQRLLNEIIAYYSSTRGVGHTKAMLHGSNDVPSIIVSHTFDWKKELERIASPKNEDAIQVVFTLQDIEMGSLRGRSCPVAFDNAALVTLLVEANLALSRKDETIQKLNDKLDRIAEIASRR